MADESGQPEGEDVGQAPPRLPRRDPPAENEWPASRSHAGEASTRRRPAGTARSFSHYDRERMASQRLYKVTFLNQGQVYEVYAKRVSQGGILGFIEVEGLVFGQKTRVVVDPTEERLQREFEGVKRCYLPMHSVVRVDEVEKQGPSRITDAAKGGNVAVFPVPYFKPDSGSES